jgi:hypothetical protein
VAEMTSRPTQRVGFFGCFVLPASKGRGRGSGAGVELNVEAVSLGGPDTASAFSRALGVEEERTRVLACFLLDRWLPTGSIQAGLRSASPHLLFAYNARRNRKWLTWASDHRESP